MNQSIRFRGLSLAKDEQAVQNGELSLCAGVELHDAALRPSVLSGTKLPNKLGIDTVDSSGNVTGSQVNDLLYVHKTTSYTHYIAFDPSAKQLNWFLSDGSAPSTHLISHTFTNGIKAIDSVGNTLVVIADDGIHYILWKNTDSKYKYLGQKPPFVTILFSLSNNQTADYETGGIDVDGSAEGFNCAFQQTTLSCEEAFNVSKKSTAFQKGETQLKVKTTKQSDITENVWGLVNRTNNMIAKAGHFYANFFVRYCYRLYDGSMVMQSAPIFMPVLVPDNYLVYLVNAHMDDDHTVGLDDTIKVHRQDTTGKEYAFSIGKATFMYYPRNVALRYTWRNDNNSIVELKEWSDIVTSIDVFVTPPVTRTDESQTIKTLVYQPDYFGLNLYQDGLYKNWENIWLYNQKSEIKTTVEFPGLSPQGYADKIASQAAFFKVASFKLDDVYGTGMVKDVPVDQAVVENVSTQELMKDDYKTHNSIYPKGLYVYNHRINVYGLYEKLFKGFTRDQMFPDGIFCSSDTKTFTVRKIVVRLNTDNGYKFVENNDGSFNGLAPYVLYNLPLFYPDARADHMYICYTEGVTDTQKWADFKLKSCNELNGAIHTGPFSTDYPTVSAPVYTVDDIVQMPNRIYTSEQNNPYYFPLEAINSVGTGDIIGLAATTRALSQGQFGQYPLMAFTTDGIWALNVSSSGTYSTIHPISREVCVNAASICQLDQSVVFATDRALNKVAESSVASFSDILDGPFFNIASALKELYDYFNSGDHVDHDIMELLSFSTPPIEYFKQGMVINDFVNNRLIVLPASSEQSQEVALVYSIRDSAWSTILIDTPRKVINSYPYPYLQQTDGSVLVLDKKYDYTDNTLYNGLLVTRTLSFDGVMQCISAFDQQTDAVSPQLLFFFGSNDNRTWHYIGRSNSPHSSYLPGHSFRFFRLAVYTKMSCAEKYFQTNLTITQKYQKL